MFSRLTPTGLMWPDGTHHEVDAIIWCTGSGPRSGTSGVCVSEPRAGIIVSAGQQAPSP